MRVWLRRSLLLVPILAILLSGTIAYASHSWNGYHWARTANTFTLQIENDLTTIAWNNALGPASTDWSASTVLNTTIVNLRAPTGNCSAILGKDVVCNKKYGSNGWLGIAQIWVYGDGHIAQGIVKLNDTYFNTTRYNTPAWRRLVVCQEVGHTLGLDHQDANFTNSNLETCMDYTNDPDGTIANPDQFSNVQLNQHDYDQLVTMYTHLDTTTSVSASSATGRAVANGDSDDEDFGAANGEKDQHGRDIRFVKNLGGGVKKFTWVFWADPGTPNSH